MCKILLKYDIYILDCQQLKIYSIGSLLKQMQWFLLMVGALSNPTLSTQRKMTEQRGSHLKVSLHTFLPTLHT